MKISQRALDSAIMILGIIVALAFVSALLWAVSTY